MYWYVNVGRNCTPLTKTYFSFDFDKSRRLILKNYMRTKLLDSQSFLVLLRRPRFNACTHVETKNSSIDQIERNRINCKILATLGKETHQLRRPVHRRKGERSPNADWIQVLWDTRPVLDAKSGLPESVLVSRSIACCFVVMILGRTNTNVAWFVRVRDDAFLLRG